MLETAGRATENAGREGIVIMEIIKVKLERTVYRKADSGWSIIKTDKGSAKGVIGWEAQDGDLLKLEGDWKISAYNGADEFVFKAAVPDIPEDSRALLMYAVELTPGLGGAMMEKIWEKYGEGWRGTADLEIPGMRETVRFHWKETLKRLEGEKAKTDAIAFLLGKGCTLNMASVAWNTWKENTAGIINGNPFMLAELPRYGFADVDNGIRQAFGIGDDDERRMTAALLYCLNRATDRGDTVVSACELRTKFAEFAKDDVENKIRIASTNMINSGKMKIISGEFVALAEDWENEVEINKRFCKAS